MRKLNSQIWCNWLCWTSRNPKEEPNHSLISGLRADTGSTEDRMEQGIMAASADRDGDVVYVNISPRRSSSSRLAWFDLLSIFRFLLAITHSSLIASCSTNRVHCIWSWCWQPKKALSLILILSWFFRSVFTSCLLLPACLSRSPARLSAASHAAAVWEILCCLFPPSLFNMMIFSWDQRSHLSQGEILPLLHFTANICYLWVCFE